MLGDAEMGLMDFGHPEDIREVRDPNAFAGYPRPERCVNSESASTRVTGGLLTTKQRRKAQTLILGASTKKDIRPEKN